MVDPVKLSKPMAEATLIDVTAGPRPSQTEAQAHPPLVAYGASSSAAISGTHTAGGTAIHGVSSGNAGLFEGNVEVKGNLNVSGDIYLPGADLAEQFDVAEMRELRPGTLVVLDRNGALRACTTPYDRSVTGVVAGAGAYRPGVILDSGAGGDQDRASSHGVRARVSLMGKAYCYVDATYGAITAGDLLTSSGTEGCAMKAEDDGRAFGAVVGKALRPLSAGIGLIPILVTLQ